MCEDIVKATNTTLKRLLPVRTLTAADRKTKATEGPRRRKDKRDTITIRTIFARNANPGNCCIWSSGTLGEDCLPPNGQALVEQSGIQGGLIVHLGCGEGALTAELRSSECYLVQGWDTDPANIDAARAHIQAHGLYGAVSVEQLDSPRLPYVDNLVNLLVVSDDCGVSQLEMRVLWPRGAS